MARRYFSYAPAKQLMAHLWLAFALIVSLLSLWWQPQTGMNNDQLSLMHATRLIWRGLEPYLDFAEINPPLIMLLYSPPYLLSAMTGLPITLSLHAFTLGLVALSLWLTFHILEISGLAARTSLVLVSTLALALMGVSFINDVFADRVHIFLALAAPWMVLCAPLPQLRAVPQAFRLGAAAMAALAFPIKPHFYLFYLASLLFRFWRNRNPRELLTLGDMVIIGFSAAYVLSMPLLFPHYLFTVMPIGWHTYGVLGWSFNARLNNIQSMLLQSEGPALGLALLGAWLTQPRRLPPAWLAYLAALTLTAAVSYLASNGWWYERYTFSALAVITTLAATAWAVSRTPLALLLLAPVMFLLWQNTVLPAYYRGRADIMMQKNQGHPLSNADPFPPAMRELEMHLMQHPRFLWLSTNLFAQGLVKKGTNRVHVGQFDYLWPLPGMLQHNQRETPVTQMVKGYITGSITRDLAEKRPGLVIIDTSTIQRGLPPDYDILAFLKTDPAFTKSWERYEKAGSVRACSQKVTANCAYEIYRRKSFTAQ